MGLKWQLMDTILVVEDEIAIREMLGRGLRQRGYEVLVAEDGDEALRMCSKHPNPIDVLLCDVVTPGLRARELIRILLLLTTSELALRLEAIAGGTCA